MNVCIPIVQDEGLESRVSPHFGSAPLFLIVDSETRALRTVPNTDQHHQHGGCHPQRLLGPEGVDAFVVGGVGAGALSQLERAGATVYGGGTRTVAEVLEALKAGTLPPLDAESACVQGHAHGSGAGHAHAHGQGQGQGQCHRHGHCRGHG